MSYVSPNQSKNARKYYEKNKDAINERKTKKYRENDNLYIYYMLKRAENRAKDKNIPFDINLSDIVVPEYCPILGIKLQVGKGSGPSDASPSLDRIVPQLGYTKGNIMVISMKANKIKSDVLLEDIEKVYLYLKSKKT
jgi:hypothetical protein